MKNIDKHKRREIDTMKNIAKQKERGQVRHADESSKIIFKWNIKKFDSIDLKIVKKMQ